MLEIGGQLHSLPVQAGHVLQMQGGEASALSFRGALHRLRPDVTRTGSTLEEACLSRQVTN